MSVFSSGRYELTASAFGWTFVGDAGAVVSNISTTAGSDSIGSWQEIAFEHDPSRSSAVRLYDARSIVLFSTRYGQSGPNADPFPRFTSYPQGLSTFSYGGLWTYSFGALNIRSPWLFYDAHANAFLFSPASNFMTAVTHFSGDGAIEGAIDGRIDTLPDGFTHTAILAFGQGINAAFDTWGKSLTDLSGKNLTSNDANALLNKLSYWTDAGAAYYYRPFQAPEYIPTLQQIPGEFAGLSAPIGSLELDSWYYQKGTPPSWTNNGEGMDTFHADPSIFPNGLASFQRSLGVPLITHARWIDAHSPLRDKYKISGNVSIDPQYWKDYAQYLSDSGVEFFEQDWLAGPAIPDFNLTDPYLFMDNMASAMQAAGRKLIYCMPLWTHILQSTKYDNVIAVRTSNDSFQRARWDELLFNSRIASAVGLWPFADAFKSVNAKDVLVATLMAGPVGTGDGLGTGHAANLSHAVRSDGVIVKPDVPLAPTDATYLAFAQSASAPVVAATHTDHAGRRTAYVLAYSRVSDGWSQITFTPASLGVAGPAYIYDFFNNAGETIQPGGVFYSVVDSSGSYYLIAPIGTSGIAFLGDADKFVSCGKKRIEQVTDDGTLRVVVRFVAGEKFAILRFYSPTEPTASAQAGSLGEVRNHGENLYRVLVRPDESGVAIVNFTASSISPI